VNIVTGNNGAGKSSLLQAIILGKFSYKQGSVYCIGKYPPPAPAGGISADVIWGNVREKERKGKKKEERGKELRKWVVKR
jgi:AAA15 family ATPase/GTPase